jgi:hypothetical protein
VCVAPEGALSPGCMLSAGALRVSRAIDLIEVTEWLLTARAPPSVKSTDTNTTAIERYTIALKVPFPRAFNVSAPLRTLRLRDHSMVGTRAFILAIEGRMYVPCAWLDNGPCSIWNTCAEVVHLEQEVAVSVLSNRPPSYRADYGNL